MLPLSSTPTLPSGQACPDAVRDADEAERGLRAQGQQRVESGHWGRAGGSRHRRPAEAACQSASIAVATINGSAQDANEINGRSDSSALIRALVRGAPILWAWGDCTTGMTTGR
jgi:hypothetical protein